MPLTEEEIKSIEIEKQKLNEDKLAFAREKLISTGFDSKRASKINSLIALEELYVDYNERKNQEEEDEKKKKEEEEIKAEKEDKDKNVKKMKVNAGIPSVTTPTGEVVNATEPYQARMNGDVPEAFFMDPLRVRREFPVIRQNARPNPLPPTNDHPYWRVV